MEGGADARARGQGCGKCGIEQERPVVIDRDQDGLRVLGVWPRLQGDFDAALFVLLRLGPGHDGQAGQHVGLGLQNIVIGGTRIQGVEKFARGLVLGQQRPRLGNAPRGLRGVGHRVHGVTC